MSTFLKETISDIRGGRESWRVVVSMTVPAFVVSILAAVVQHPF
jgi:hypothetical protein